MYCLCRLRVEFPVTLGMLQRTTAYRRSTRRPQVREASQGLQEGGIHLEKDELGAGGAADKPGDNGKASAVTSAGSFGGALHIAISPPGRGYKQARTPGELNHIGTTILVDRRSQEQARC
jgi:hypothetical protein